jgi:hypothetical protein
MGILSHDSVGNEDQTVTRKETRDSNQMEKQKNTTLLE